jgi:hypothetical protein
MNGLLLSQKFKPFKCWDAFVEPFIIHQFGVFFIAGHSFIKGLVSDNNDKVGTQSALTNLENVIEQEFSPSTGDDN